MSRKKGNVRCIKCGALFDLKAYSGALIEGVTLCEACAKSNGYWVPITERVRRSKIKKSVQTDESSEIVVDIPRHNLVGVESLET